MVVDFKDLKEIVNNLIIYKTDHAFAYNIADEQACAIVKTMKEQIKQKCLPLTFRVTSENLAKWIFVELDNYFKENVKELKMVEVKLWETPTSYSTYNLK